MKDQDSSIKCSKEIVKIWLHYLLIGLEVEIGINFMKILKNDNLINII